MGRESRVPTEVKLNRALKITLAVLLFSFFIYYNAGPKTNCDVCSLEYNDGTSVAEFAEYYQDTCLSNKYEPKKEVYIPLEDIVGNITLDSSLER